MQRLILAGALALSALLALENRASANAATFAPGGGSFTLGFRIRFGFDVFANCSTSNCYNNCHGCGGGYGYTPPAMGDAQQYLGAHPWANYGPFGPGYDGYQGLGHGPAVPYTYTGGWGGYGQGYGY